MKNILFVKYNRTRREKFQISTTIYEENGKKYALKKPLCKEADSHIIGLKEKAEKLEKTYNQVKILMPNIIENTAVYQYLEGETLEKQIFDVREVKEELFNKLDDINSIIFDFSKESLKEFVITDGFREVFGNIEGLSGKAVKVANIDCNYDNFIEVNGKIYCIDCEWVVDGLVPVEYLIYRSVFYFYHKYYMYLERIVSYEEYMSHFGINPQMLDIYEKMEENSQHYVHGKNRESIYTQNYKKPIKPIENLEEDLDSLGQLQARDKDIAWLNELCANKDEYIEYQKKIIEEIRSNPMYKIGRIPAKIKEKILKK